MPNEKKFIAASNLYAIAIKIKKMRGRQQSGLQHTCWGYRFNADTHHYLAGLGKELRGEVLESAIQGNTRCRFVFYLPDSGGR